MTKKIINIAVVAIVITISVFFYMRYRVAPDITSFEITYAVDGQNAKVSDLQGRNVVIAFYAAWCGTCHREFPHLIAAAEEMAADDFVFIALTDDTPEDIDKMKAHYGVPFGMHKLSKSLKENQIFSLPTTYVLNKSGEIVFKKVEEIDWSDAAFRQEIRQLVQ